MFHLELYTASITFDGALHQLTAVGGGIVPTVNSGFQVPTLNNLMAAFTLGVHATRAQIQSPRLRNNPYPDLIPVNRGTAFESPVRYQDFSRAPLALNVTDEIDYFAAQVQTAAEASYGGVIFCDRAVSPLNMAGGITVHGTAAKALTAGAWTTVSFNLDQALEAGTYSIRGVRMFSATGLFFRMLPTGGPIWQPGGTMVNAYDQLTPDYQRHGGWGEWGTFVNTTPPNWQIYATAADAAEEIWLDLVQVG